jgi:D-serine deaminase-like pyridoxal phosphate-dependent protein
MIATLSAPSAASTAAGSTSSLEGLNGPSAIGLPKSTLDTPALVVNLDALERNIARMADTFKRAGVAWRPHTKGQKVPALAHRLLRAGAHGVTCAKVSEAEVLAGAGIPSILIANQVIGDVKVRRVAALCRSTDVIVGVDSEYGVDQLARAAASAGSRPRVLVEVDTGMGRCGVSSAEAVVALAKRVAASPSLRFAGVMGWEGHCAAMKDLSEKKAAVAAALQLLTGAAEACRAADLPVEIVSCSGTGTYQIAAFEPGITEVQAGGGIFGDVHYRDDFGVDHECALTVVTTVISRPNPQLIVTDGGFKTLSGTHSLPEPLGPVKALLSKIGLSAEHGRLELKEASDTPRVGDKLEFIVGYSDSTVFMHDVMYATRGGTVESAWDIAGRGKLQ